MTMSPELSRIGVRAWATGGAAAIFAAALLLPRSASSATLAFTNGDTLSGAVIGYAKGLVVFRAARFGEIAVAPDVLREIRSDQQLVLTTMGGETLRSPTLISDGIHLSLQTRFGPAEIAWSEIASLQDESAGSKEPSRPAAREAATPTRAAGNLRNELSTNISLIGNELSGFSGTSRTYLWDDSTTYTRAIGPGRSVSLTLPAYYQAGRTSGVDGDDVSHRSGLGDVSFAFNQQVRVPSGWPQVQVKFTVGVPTGRADGPSDTTLLGLSSGNWSAGAQLTLNVPLNPGTLMGSVGMTRYWPSGRDGSDMRDFGWAFQYAVPLEGARTVNFSLSGSIVDQDHVRSEPAYMTISIIQELANGVTIAPTFAHGVNSDAQDYLVGLNIAKAW